MTEVETGDIIVIDGNPDEMVITAIGYECREFWCQQDYIDSPKRVYLKPMGSKRNDDDGELMIRIAKGSVNEGLPPYRIVGRAELVWTRC